MKILRSRWIYGFAGVILAFASHAPASFASTPLPPCDPASLTSAQMFNCGVPQNLPPLQFGSASTYQSAGQFFPSHWDQLHANQQHNPVFPVSAGAPSFLQQGTFWAAPLTGDKYLRVANSYKNYAYDSQKWGSQAAQWLGNAMSVSVVSGIVYAQNSSNSLFALDAASGIPIWSRSDDPPPGGQSLPPLGAPLVNAAMGQSIVEVINGRFVVFATVGDVAFTLQHMLEFKDNTSQIRGANFNSVYALDGLTGKELWRFDMAGTGMPTPVYKNGTLFVNTGDGHLYALDGQTGALLSTVSNPGLGFSSMSSVNWFTTSAGRLLMIYGTQKPNNMVAVDVTVPTNPTLAWSYALPNGISTGLGDVPPAVDPNNGLVVTGGLVRVGTRPDGSPQLDVNVFALDANTGLLKWSRYACRDYYADPLNSCSVSPVSFRGSVPMIHNGNVYMGVLLDESYRSYDVNTGNLRWVTPLHTVGETETHQPRGGGVWYDGKVIEAEGRHIRTFDPNTGAILNDFASPGYFAVWGIPTPIVVGGQMYIGGISGWIFAAPIRYVMTTSGGIPGLMTPPTNLTLPKQSPEYYNPQAMPTRTQAAIFPRTWLAYAGGQDHNAVVSPGPANVAWQTALNGALPLEGPPRDESIFGSEVASDMTTLAFGVGSGLAPTKGIIYTCSNHYTVNALNAITGQVVWRFRTVNANFGQPLVTPNTVVSAAGDPWIGFGELNKFVQGNAFTVGASFQNLHGLDPLTGTEKWTFYTNGTNAMTPLYNKGNLYWVDGSGHLWAINADTGNPVAPFLDANSLPALPRLAGDNAHSSANIYYGKNDKFAAIMLIGTMSGMYGIDLGTGSVLWTQTLSSFNPYTSGFAGASPLVDQDKGLVIGTFISNADATTHTATLQAFALDATTGAIVWTQNLGSGPIPTGFTSATAVIKGRNAYVLNPLSGTEIALDKVTGNIMWQTSVQMAGGRLSWGPGAVTEGYLIQPVGPDLVTFDTKTGTVVYRLTVGGSFTYNNPTVVGSTVYIGNGWGWVVALPLAQVTGGYVSTAI